MKERLARILQILLGLLFIVSAILKIADMDRFEIYVYSYHFFSLNLSFLVARAAIILELVLGMGLVFNIFNKLIWWGSVLMLLGYTGLLVYAMVLGRTDNCHCFGDYLQFNPWQSIIKNVVLLALFALIYRVKSRRFKYDVLALVGMVIACCVAVFVVSPPDNYTPNYASSQDLNRELFEEALQQPPLDTQNLMEGKKVVAFLSSSCDYCMLAARKLSLMQQFYGFSGQDILYVFMGDEESIQQFYQESESPAYPYVIYEDVLDLIKINNGVFPLVVMMDNGVIVHEYGLRNMKEEEIKAFFKP
ncbi:MAG: hypothetical protein K5920_05160 [Bacteroidales bacterium]|nr:hypothetical protein [Bacteroidales bacterium]